jgi:protein associated with RNAse G/E
MSKYNITDPSFGIWNETDEVVDIQTGTISDGYSKNSTDFFCPYCYFNAKKIYNSLPYFDDDGALPKCDKHGPIDWNRKEIKILIQDVERDIVKNRN